MQNDLGKSALHFAAIRDQAPVISLLCSKGAKVNQPDKMGHTPLHRACDWNSKAASKELIKFGANPRTKNKVNTIDNLIEINKLPHSYTFFHYTYIYIYIYILFKLIKKEWDFSFGIL